jgi:hypothetical protein
MRHGPEHSQDGRGSAWLAAALCAVAGVVLISLVRAPLLDRYRAPTSHEHASLLISPEYSLAFSLGHREALADYLFSNLLVQYGIGFQERQRFEPTSLYLDTITTLAPKFARPYLFADTLLTMRPQAAQLQDYLDARRIQERGLKALPSLTELWLVAGQFAAYLAPPYLPASLQEEFKQAGARDLARACELANNNQNIAYNCVGAARLLNRQGQRDAMIRMLSRTLAVNDDPDLRKLAIGYLEHEVGERDKDRYERRVQALEKRWKAQMPQATRILMSLLGPGPDIWKCVGASASGTSGCETTWRDWAETLARSDS